MNSRSHKVRWIFLVLAAVLGLLGAWFWAFGFCRSTSLCSICGARQSQSVILLIPFRKVEQTKLSRLHDEMEGNNKHEHQWSFEHGSGGQISCAIGKASHLSGMTDNADLERGLRAILYNQGEQEATDWIRRILDMNQAEERRWLLICPDLQDDVETPEGFGLWYQKVYEDWKFMQEIYGRAREPS